MAGHLIVLHGGYALGPSSCTSLVLVVGYLLCDADSGHESCPKLCPPVHHCPQGWVAEDINLVSHVLDMWRAELTSKDPGGALDHPFPTSSGDNKTYRGPTTMAYPICLRVIECPAGHQSPCNTGRTQGFQRRQPSSPELAEICWTWSSGC